MTNIMSFISNKEDNPVAVVMADGLASGGQQKSDGHQKIFPVGNNYLLGTGGGDLIEYVADELYNETNSSPKELSNLIIKTLGEGCKLRSEEIINFIVTGRMNNDIESYHVQYPRFVSPKKKGAIISDGSGSPFVANAYQRDCHKGLFREINKLSIGDLSALSYDYGMAATKSSGVNGQLQFGFITSYGNATLLHPQVRITTHLKEYDTLEKQKSNTDFYSDFINDLYNYTMLEVRAHQMTNDRLFNITDSRKFSRDLTKITKKLDDIRGKLDNMVENYVTNYNRST
jgi:hypothetical protein